MKLINPADPNFLDLFAELTVESVIEMGHERYLDYQRALETALEETPRIVHIEGRADLPCLSLTTENKMIKSEVELGSWDISWRKSARDAGFCRLLLSLML